MKVLKKVIITSVLMSISSVALAVQISTPKTVKRIFTENSTSGDFMLLKEYLNVNGELCFYNYQVQLVKVCFLKF